MHNTDLMNRQDVITRIKSVEPSLRASGVGALYRFGSYGRDEARPDSDIDIFVEAAVPAFYNLSNYMGAYATLSDVFPNKDIGLLDTIRPVEIHTRSSRTRCCAGFLMAASKTRLHASYIDATRF